MKNVSTFSLSWLPLSTWLQAKPSYHPTSPGLGLHITWVLSHPNLPLARLRSGDPQGSFWSGSLLKDTISIGFLLKGFSLRCGCELRETQRSEWGY